MPFCHLYGFFGEMSIWSSYFDWLFKNILSYMNCLYSLEINLLQITLLANVFSHFMGCLFVLLWFPLLCKKLLSLIKSQMFVFPLFPLLWETDPKRYVAIYVRVLCLCFPKESYTVWSYIYIQVFNPFLVYFCVWYQRMF